MQNVSVQSYCYTVPTDKKAKLPLSKTHPKLAKEALGWDPKTINATSNKKLDWKCPKGHIWQCTPSSRISQVVNCSICSGRQLLTGFNDFEKLSLIIEMASDSSFFIKEFFFIFFITTNIYK